LSRGGRLPGDEVAANGIPAQSDRRRHAEQPEARADERAPHDDKKYPFQQDSLSIARQAVRLVIPAIDS